MAGNPAMMVDPWGLDGESSNPLIPNAKPTSSSILPFFGSTPPRDQTGIAASQARETQKPSSTGTSGSPQESNTRTRDRPAKKKKKRRAPRNTQERFENGVEDGFEIYLGGVIEGVVYAPETFEDAFRELAGDPDRFIEIVLEHAADIVVSVGTEVLDLAQTLNPVGWVLDDAYDNGQKLGKLMAVFTVAFVTGGITAIGAVAARLPKFAKAASGGAKGGQSTLHGAERVAGDAATRGGVLSVEGINATKTLGRAFTQKDGATVFLHEVAPGRFNAVVQGSRGIITTMENWSQKSINRIAKNYGWKLE